MIFSLSRKFRIFRIDFKGVVCVMLAKSNSYICCSNVRLTTLGKNKYSSLLLQKFATIDIAIAVGQVAKATKRAGKLSKVVLNHIFQRQEQITYDYCVFVSRFGELDSIEKNNEDNTINEELSPTSFSYSVHNAIACLYAIVSGSKIPSTSLSVSNGMIRTALLECLSYISSHADDKNVLIVVYDGFMPDRYKDQFSDYPNDFVLSFSVQVGNRESSPVLFADELHELKSF